MNEIAAPPASRVKGFDLHADLSSETRAALVVQSCAALLCNPASINALR